MSEAYVKSEERVCVCPANKFDRILHVVALFDRILNETLTTKSPLQGRWFKRLEWGLTIKACVTVIGVDVRIQFREQCDSYGRIAQLSFAVSE
jgi:hypothetical protein